VLFIRNICVVKYAYKIWKIDSKYLYMIPYQNRIKNQSNNNLQEHYAIISQPTTATSIPTQTMEGNEEKTSLRQACKVIRPESRMAKDKEAKGQA
jgi:hypothetical protein